MKANIIESNVIHNLPSSRNTLHPNERINIAIEFNKNTSCFFYHHINVFVSIKCAYKAHSKPSHRRQYGLQVPINNKTLHLFKCEFYIELYMRISNNTETCSNQHKMSCVVVIAHRCRHHRTHSHRAELIFSKTNDHPN